MADTKHTPGPWKVAPAIRGYAHMIQSPLAYAPADIPECGGQEDANAHLIAAAPTIYKALDRLVEMLEIPYAEWDGEMDNLALTGLVGIAKAALAAARGEVKP